MRAAPSAVVALLGWLDCSGPAPSPPPADRATPDAPASAPIWHEAADRAALRRAADLAVARGRPLFVDVRASWCTPCLALENGTFADARVERVLGAFIAVRLDVSEASAEQQALQRALDASTLPSLLAWRDAGPLARALAQADPGDPGAALPEATVAIRVAVEPPELLSALAPLAP